MMRPIRSGDEEVLSDKQSLAAVHEAWNTWEIHFLMLLSLFLQVFLFLTASLRRYKTSLILRTVLWLVYLSADAVAIFVLGHLAVRASEPGHQLMSFWAPFVLVHLGGQDTITAFSKQDNELWRRHLLSLVTQVAVAAYVVAKASWRDRLLKSAMVLMFLAGCFKYTERTLCLYLSNPSFLRSNFLDNLSTTLGALRVRERSNDDTEPAEYMRRILDLFSEGKIHGWGIHYVVCVDAPPNKEQSILAVDSLPSLLEEFRSNTGRYGAYESAGSHLVNSYDLLYTKRLRQGINVFITEVPDMFNESFFNGIIEILVLSPFILYLLFQFVSALAALVLFIVAENGDMLHTSPTDITVSYILLVGAVALEVSSATMFLLSKFYPSATWRRKQWSEELRQYSMIKRHVVQGTASLLSSIRQWIGRRLGKWGVELLDLTHTPITEPVKALILDNLLLHGIRKEWHVASSRGLLAVQNWKERHQDYLPSKSTAEALEKTINGVADFPTSALIWHLATDMCYYYSGDAYASTRNSNHSNDQVKKKDNNKEMSRQISNYIMYLVFKCGVKLTTNSQHLHDKAHQEIRDTLSRRQNHRQRLGEKAAFMKIFQASKKDGEEEQIVHSTSDVTTIQHDDTAAGDNHVKKLLQSAQAFDSPVLPRACKLAQMLISIDEGDADRWGLIGAVWSEMLYYAAPRCGGAFHYEHLSTGGEFVTHVLVLMHELGPFMPSADDPA